VPTSLHALWDEPRPPPPPARVWPDRALIAALVPLALLEGTLRPDVQWRALSVIVTIALMPTLLGRRTRPLLMVTIAFGVHGLVSLAVGASVPELGSSAYVLLLVLALFRWGSGREMAIGSLIVLSSVGGLGILGYLTASDTFGGFAVLSTTAASGAAVRYRGRAKLRELEQVKLLERERLARDLHDTVAQGSPGHC
jgi:signal transduction histidine kinase